MDDYRGQYNTYEPQQHDTAVQTPTQETVVATTESQGLAVVGGFAKDYWPILLIILIGIGLFLWLNKCEGGIKSRLSGLFKSDSETL